MMDLPLPDKIRRDTALRYMGAAGWQPDKATCQLMDGAEEMLRACATPRCVWRELPRAALSENAWGSDLSHHLDGAQSVVFFAATLGTGVDALLRRWEISDIALAAVADAMASVLLEQVCDVQETQIRQEFSARGRYLTGRYAPGYGDCPLELNDILCRALDTVRGCGLAVTPQHLLAPRKSTTAILGAASHPITGARAGCAACHLRERCAYRKRGTTCAKL